MLLLQENGRIVQSLGTPYQGCPLAGLLAYLGDLLGIGCGLNEDLTYDGAEQWLSKIPLDKRAEVYYYTTQVAILTIDVIIMCCVYIHVTTLAICTTASYIVTNFNLKLVDQMNNVLSSYGE